MAVIVITEDHDALIRQIDSAIAAGVADDWEMQGRELRMLTGIGAGIRMRATKDDDALVFGVVPAVGKPLTPASYAAVHARLAELLLELADSFFDSAEITARCSEYDYQE
jgi:hypothetical protein